VWPRPVYTERGYISLRSVRRALWYDVVVCQGLQEGTQGERTRLIRLDQTGKRHAVHTFRDETGIEVNDDSARRTLPCGGDGERRFHALCMCGWPLGCTNALWRGLVSANV
jgi:hypothetical protein